MGTKKIGRIFVLIVTMLASPYALAVCDSGYTETTKGNDKVCDCNYKWFGEDPNSDAVKSNCPRGVFYKLDSDAPKN